jgi:hypothetical protein
MELVRFIGLGRRLPSETLAADRRSVGCFTDEHAGFENTGGGSSALTACSEDRKMALQDFTRFDTHLR